MIKLKSIRIQGMHNVTDKTYNLSDFTYFYGDNGAGKSTILQAIQLALLGYIPGTNKTNTAIFKHSNSSTMQVNLKLSNDGNTFEIMRKYYLASASTVKCQEEIPEGFDIDKILGGLHLPIFDFNEFIKLTADKLKDWFINFLPSSNYDINIESEIKQVTEDIVKIDPKFISEIISYSNDIFETLDNPVDALKQITEHIKNLLSFKKSELQKTESTIQTLMFYEDVSTMNESVEELKSELNQINTKTTVNNNLINKLNDKKRLTTNLNLVTSNMKSVSDSYEVDSTYLYNKKMIESLQNTNESLNIDIKCIESTKSELETKVAVIKAEISTNQDIIDKGGICPYTKSSCDSIISLIDELKCKINTAKAKLEDYQLNISKLDDIVSQKHSEIEDNLKEIEDYSRDNYTIQNNYNLINQYKSEISEINVPEELTVESLNSEIEVMSTRRTEIEDTLIKIEANKKYNDLYENLASEKMKINENLIALKALQKLTDVNGLQSKIMNIPFVNLSDKLTKYLNVLYSKNTEAKFIIDGGANNFNFGFTRNGEYIQFDTLSSGEKCIYTLALILSLIESSNGDMKVILIDDLFDHLDSNNFSYMFDNLVKIENVQFVFAGVEPASMLLVNSIDIKEV